MGKIKKGAFIDWFLPVFIIIAPYRIGGSFSNYGIVVLILYTLHHIFILRREILLNKQLVIFTILANIIYVFDTFRFGSFTMTNLNNILMPFVQVLILSVITITLNYERFYKFYTFFGSLAMIIIIFQSVRLYLWGIPAVPITLLPISPKDLHFWGDLSGARPSGLFSEPQAYASYMLPLLILSLNKKHFKFALLIGISIFLSSSSLGILMVGFIFVYYVINMELNFHLRIGLLLLSVILFLSFFEFDVFEFARTKIAETPIEDNIRLVRGFIVFSNFNITNALFGIGDNLQSYVINNLNYPWVYAHIKSGTERLLGYTTTISGVLIRYGIISSVVFFSFLYKLYRKDKTNTKLLLIVIIILSFAQTLLFNSWFVFYYSIYLGLSSKEYAKNDYISIKIK